jgi:hypothetical protein
MLRAIAECDGGVSRVAAMRGVRYFLRQFTAMSVNEPLRSEIEDQGRPPELTKHELELVRFVREGRFDWDAYLAERS